MPNIDKTEIRVCTPTKEPEKPVEVAVNETEITEVDHTNDSTLPQPTVEIPTEEPPSQNGVKAKDDYRYKKYFKMVQFGVPSAAVKQKLQAEGMDPDILDSPEKVLPDGVLEPPPRDDTDDTD